MNGFDNEFQFVMALNNKKVGLLNPMLYDLVCTLFGDSINDDMIIKSCGEIIINKKLMYLLK